MNSSLSEWLWIIYDIVTLAIIVFFIVTNTKRGFGLIVVSAAGYIISCVIASSASNLLGHAFYDSFLKTELTDKTYEVIQKYDVGNEMNKCIADMTLGLNIKKSDIEKYIKKSDTDTLDKSIYKLITNKSAGAVSSVDEVTAGIVDGINSSIEKAFDGRIPVSMLKGMCNFTIENKTDAFKLWKLFADDMTDREMAEYIEENYIREYAVMFVKIFLFILVFFALMVVFKVAEGMLISRDKVFTLGKFNAAGGCILGIIEAVAVVVILSILVRFALLLSDGTETFFNEDVIEQSKIFSIFYNFNLMG